MGILAASLNLVVQAGATWTEQLTYKDANGDPIDLTTWSARMEVRASMSAPIATMTLLSSDVSPDPRLVLGGALGTINIVVEAIDTTAMINNNSETKLVYGLELYKMSGPVEKVLSLLLGEITVSPEVVRG